MYTYFKRFLDFSIATIILIILSPLLLIASVLIRINMGKPILFRQMRPGKNEKIFTVYKFRTMRDNHDKNGKLLPDAERLTQLGKFIRTTSIDELPQFINVLMGDMSVVGPRPHMLKHTEEYAQVINKFMVRHFVKPGITGWAQVTGYRGETKELWQMEGRVSRDIWYIEHWTFMLDLYIIYKTVYNAIHGEKEAY